MPSSRRIPRPAPAGVQRGVVGGDDDAFDPRLADRVGARRRPALVAARLERDVQRRATEVLRPGGTNRLDFRVGAPELAVKALAEDLTVPGDHGADERIGADLATALLSQLDRSGKVAAIGVGLERHVCWPEG